jgi:hypothetical protein
MCSASTHHLHDRRVRITVAELLDRAAHGAGESERAAAQRWSAAVAPRRQLTRASGSLLAVGSIICTAALCGQPQQGGPLGQESAESGHPLGRLVPPPEVRPASPVPAPSTARVVRTARVTPAPARPRPRPGAAEPRVSAPLPERREVRAPAAGSALSSLTAPIRPVDALGSLLGGLT